MAWWVVRFPYKTRADIKCYMDGLPPGVTDVKSGVGSALRSIQKITGKPPSRLVIDLGIVDVVIKGPTRKGEPGAIRYKRDVKQKTRGDITIGKPVSRSTVRGRVKRRRDGGKSAEVGIKMVRV